MVNPNITQVQHFENLQTSKNIEASPKIKSQYVNLLISRIILVRSRGVANDYVFVNIFCESMNDTI